MRVQFAAFIAWVLAMAAYQDYTENFNCGIQEKPPTEASFVCAAAIDKPGAFICCEPNKMFAAASYGLLGAWFLAFSLGLIGGTIYICDLFSENVYKELYETAEVEQGEASTALPMPATQAAAYRPRIDVATLGAT